MSTSNLRIVSPEHLTEAVRSGPLHEALVGIAQLVGADLIAADAAAGGTKNAAALPSTEEIPVEYNGESVGRVLCENGSGTLSPGKKRSVTWRRR